MGTFGAIVVAALCSGVFATLAAAFTLRLRAAWIPRLVSFAVGALLGAVFLELLPHALEHGDAPRVMTTVLAGLLAFFLLEKLVLWRHAHGHDMHADDVDESEHDHALHGHAHAEGGRPGLMILIGNAVHSLCDGIVIAAAFIADHALGVATTLAIVAHAVPQQVGDFAVLLHSGFPRRKAFAYNVTAGVATLAGALAAYFALGGDDRAAPDGARDRGVEPAVCRGGGPDSEPAPARRADRDGQAVARDRPGTRGDRDRARRARALSSRPPRERTRRASQRGSKAERAGVSSTARIVPCFAAR